MLMMPHRQLGRRRPALEGDPAVKIEANTHRALTDATRLIPPCTLNAGKTRYDAHLCAS